MSVCTKYKNCLFFDGEFVKLSARFPGQRLGLMSPHVGNVTPEHTEEGHLDSLSDADVLFKVRHIC